MESSGPLPLTNGNDERIDSVALGSIRGNKEIE